MKQYICMVAGYACTVSSHCHELSPHTDGSSMQRCPRLLLFFAGWGMDEHPFLQYAPQDSDLMICYDYRTLDFDTSLLTGYAVIDVVAWSMGVWVASQVLSNVSLPIRRRIAINGTPFLIDEKRGIPPAIFMGTLKGLNEVTLRKFQRRMCTDGNAFTRFQLTSPQRGIEELKEELVAVAGQYRTLPAGTFTWEQAIIGENDRIFPPANQRTAWKGIFTSDIDGNMTQENTEKGNTEKNSTEKSNTEENYIGKENIEKKKSEIGIIKEGDIITGNEAHYDESLFIKYLKEL